MITVSPKTCFGCNHADTCTLDPVTNEFRVDIQGVGYAVCRGYDMFQTKPLTKEDALCGRGE